MNVPDHPITGLYIIVAMAFAFGAGWLSFVTAPGLRYGMFFVLPVGFVTAIVMFCLQCTFGFERFLATRSRTR